jgi:hypothetical protein
MTKRNFQVTTLKFEVQFSNEVPSFIPPPPILPSFTMIRRIPITSARCAGKDIQEVCLISPPFLIANIKEPIMQKKLGTV